MQQGWQTAADKRKDADPLVRHRNATRADSAPRPLLPCCIVSMCLRQSALKAEQKANPLLRIFCFQLSLITWTHSHTLTGRPHPQSERWKLTWGRQTQLKKKKTYLDSVVVTSSFIIRILLACGNTRVYLWINGLILGWGFKNTLKWNITFAVGPIHKEIARK